MEKRTKLIDSRPAPYSTTATAEGTSADIFHYLLSRKYIQGLVSIQDKVPNTDGLLTITDSDRVPIAYVDVQLKTLKRVNANKPKYQCEKELLAYAWAFRRYVTPYSVAN